MGLGLQTRIRPLFLFQEKDMTVREKYSYDNAEFAPLRDPARAVIASYQDANRALDTIQEFVLIEEGMPNLASVIHNQAHLMPPRFDKFAEMLHERHLMAEYPATAEMDWREELKGLDDVFRCVIDAMEDIQDALEAFHAATDNPWFRPMSLLTEELMAENSADYTKFLDMWARWDNDGGSKTSFDSWVRHFAGLCPTED